MAKDVLVKGVDEDAYRGAKARAALEGITMGKAVSEALSLWAAGEREAGLAREHRRNLEFVRTAWKAIERNRGKAVVVSAGALQGVFGSYTEACEFSSKFRVAMTFVVGERPTEREIELGPDLELQQGA